MKFTANNKLGNGRPLGSKNVATAEIRERFNLLVENNIDKLQKDISSLEPFQRLKIIIELSKFVLPTLKSVDVTTAADNDDTFFKKVTVHIIEPHDEEA
jgi:hypothetical protein